MSLEERARVKSQEADRRRQLMHDGILKRLWRIPGRAASICLYEVQDATTLQAILESMPFWPWLDAHVEPLATHHLEQEVEDQLHRGQPRKADEREAK